MTAYYNEIDPYAAAWLRNLIAAGLIVPGDVDERSIVDVRPDDLRGYVQHHFFAGIAGWSLALRLAGWPDDRPVWTGSCPCQPFSGFGKRRGHADERHLWPAFYRRIAECAPPIVFGEQVASVDGREWLSAVRADLEAAGYAVGAADLPAACKGAWHARQRLWFVAHHDGDGFSRALLQLRPRRPQQAAAVPSGIGTDPSNDDSERQPHVERLTAAQAGEKVRFRPGMDGGEANEPFYWPPEPGVGRVVHGLPETVDQLRALGNCIVPQVAAEFIKAAM